jgi:hypothetical protein
MKNKKLEWLALKTNKILMRNMVKIAFLCFLLNSKK